MNSKLKIILAQLDFLVGDIEGNAEKIINAARKAQQQYQADLIVFPELALTGYPPEDLLYRPEFFHRIDKALPLIAAASKNIAIIVGYPEFINNSCYNQAGFFQNGELHAHYHKQILPNYSVFDEKRYFKPGTNSCIITIKSCPIAITICEDLWSEIPVEHAKHVGAKLIITLNASPFSKIKNQIRQDNILQRCEQVNLPIIYVNCVGGQDELVFDGGSMVSNAAGKIIYQADFFKENLYPIEFKLEHNQVIPLTTNLPISEPNPLAQIYNALVLGVRDYIKKNSCSRAVIGLSGGIDSALTLAIAVDALGKDCVEAVMMPSRFTSQLSLDMAQEQANKMGVAYSIISIEPIFESFLQALKAEFAGTETDATEENIQARCRGTLLMAISNKKHAIVLATGNKSEMSMGYSTLYGDMVGGFCVLKDVFKTVVYQLAEYRNSISEIIPKAVIERLPTAELAENQTDQDSLPPYGILDAILERYIEHDQCMETIIDAGFEPEIVRKVVLAIDRNEYKRRQSAPGVRITERAFGKDRRYPITSGFNRHRSQIK